jgi:hypothetical protein
MLPGLRAVFRPEPTRQTILVHEVVFDELARERRATVGDQRLARLVAARGVSGKGGG